MILQILDCIIIGCNIFSSMNMVVTVGCRLHDIVNETEGEMNIPNNHITHAMTRSDMSLVIPSSCLCTERKCLVFQHHSPVHLSI